MITHGSSRSPCRMSDDCSEAYDRALEVCSGDQERETVSKRRALTAAEKKRDDARQKEAFGRLFEKEVYQDKPIPVLKKKQPDPPNVHVAKKNGFKELEPNSEMSEQQFDAEIEEDEDDKLGLFASMWMTFKETCGCKKHKQE
jgi:hypothetical protein